jgi:hypothetical protein
MNKILKNMLSWKQRLPGYFFFILLSIWENFLWSLIHILVKTLLIKKINFRTEETNNLSHEIKININKLETILNKWNESGINTSCN